MEALTAVAIAGLTLHDMIKAVDPRAVLGEIRLLEKSGGKHGEWTRDAPVRAQPRGIADRRPRSAPDRTAAVLVSSTAAAAGTRADTTGPLIVEWLRARGFDVGDAVVDGRCGRRRGARGDRAAAPDVVLTTGGTGLHPQDRTPEATRALLDLELPGIARGDPRARDARPFRPRR